EMRPARLEVPQTAASLARLEAADQRTNAAAPSGERVQHRLQTLAGCRAHDAAAGAGLVFGDPPFEVAEGGGHFGIARIGDAAPLDLDGAHAAPARGQQCIAPRDHVLEGHGVCLSSDSWV